MLRNLEGQFWNAAEWQMDVTDEAGATIYVIRIQGRTGSA
jgi:hypothetical protein